MNLPNPETIKTINGVILVGSGVLGLILGLIDALIHSHDYEDSFGEFLSVWYGTVKFGAILVAIICGVYLGAKTWL